MHTHPHKGHGLWGTWVCKGWAWWSTRHIMQLPWTWLLGHPGQNHTLRDMWHPPVSHPQAGWAGQGGTHRLLGTGPREHAHCPHVGTRWGRTLLMNGEHQGPVTGVQLQQHRGVEEVLRQITQEGDSPARGKCMLAHAAISLASHCWQESRRVRLRTHGTGTGLTWGLWGASSPAHGDASSLEPGTWRGLCPPRTRAQRESRQCIPFP